jgi:hypothetical protein
MTLRSSLNCCLPKALFDQNRSYFSRFWSGSRLHGPLRPVVSLVPKRVYNSFHFRGQNCSASHLSLDLDLSRLVPITRVPAWKSTSQPAVSLLQKHKEECRSGFRAQKKLRPAGTQHATRKLHGFIA